MKETIKYSLAMRANPMKPEEEKRAYATLQSNGLVTLDDLTDHIRAHGSNFTEGTIIGVLRDMVVCAREALIEGNYVELGRLGKLKLTISSEGSAAGVDKDGNPVTAYQAFTEDKIKALNVIFEPGQGLQWDLAKDVNFEFTTSRAAQAAAKRASKEGKTQADWTQPVDGEQEP